MENLTHYPLLLFVAVFVALWLASVAGSWLRRRNLSAEDEQHEDLGILLGATLTLLALIIGFSVSMASSRYDQRKSLEEAEANAIGTEMLRADLLPPADAANVRKLLGAYLDQRILYYINRETARRNGDRSADWPIASRSLGSRPRTRRRRANSGCGAGARWHERRDQFAGLHSSSILEPDSPRRMVAHGSHRTLL